MAAPNKQVVIPREDDEKVSSVVVYADSFLFWGDVVTKERIRVSTWLRTNAAPESVCVYNAMVIFPGAANAKPISYPELHIPTLKIVAFHLMPPAVDPIDYDPSETHRKMEPVSALAGEFRLDGLLRMAESADLKKYLEISREVYTPLYDVSISHPALTQMNLPKVSYVIVRQSATAFARRVG
jgi:hypothetical protein